MARSGSARKVLPDVGDISHHSNMYENRMPRFWWYPGALCAGDAAVNVLGSFRHVLFLLRLLFQTGTVNGYTYFRCANFIMSKPILELCAARNC